MKLIVKIGILKIGDAMKKLNKKGFTLVEIIAATIILIVILLLATKTFVFLSQKARKDAFVTEIQTYIKGAEAYYQVKKIDNDLEGCKKSGDELICSIDINDIEGDYVKKTDVNNSYNGCIVLKFKDGNFTASEVLISNGLFTYSGNATGIKAEDLEKSNILASCDGFSGIDTDGKEEEPGEDAESKEEVPETSDKATLLERNSYNSTENYYAYADKIVEIEFVKHKNFGDAKLKWDVALPDSENGITKDAIIAWLETSKLDSSKYILYIGSDKEIYAPSYSGYLFYNFCDLQTITFNNFNTSSVTNMRGMFMECKSLISLNLNNFNTSSVTVMAQMFYKCESLTSLNLSGFDTSNVTTMNSMFYACESLTSLNLSNFNTSKVSDMKWMFGHCVSLISLDLSGFDTSSVTDMSCMFAGCKALTSLDLSSFNTSKVENMTSMFEWCISLTSLDLSSFNTSEVTDMYKMFYNCDALTSLDLSAFDTSNVTDMSYMFGSCDTLTVLYLGAFDISNVTNVLGMFHSINSSLDIYFDDEISKNNFINKNITILSSVDILVGEPNI